MLKSFTSLTGRGGPMVNMFVVSCVRKSSHLAMRQLKRGVDEVLSGETSRAPMTGKWSVWAGRNCGQVSHSMKEGRRSALQKTLSGREKLPVRKACKVGVPAGSAISMLWVSSRAMSWLAASRLAVVNRPSGKTGNAICHYLLP